MVHGRHFGEVYSNTKDGFTGRIICIIKDGTSGVLGYAGRVFESAFVNIREQTLMTLVDEVALMNAFSLF